MKAKAVSVFSLLLFLVALAGCGYHPMGSEAQIAAAAGRPTVAIPMFTNRSTEVGLEAVLANALVQTFSQNNQLRVTPKEEDADLVLEGKVASVEHSSLAYFDVNTSTVRRLTVRVELSLKKRSTGKTIWKETSVFNDDYVVNPNYQIGEATRAEGLRRAAYTLARRVLDKVLLVI
jgi:outer membrane lipopolysaccharide assembly protein LptE/RlpB